MVGIDIKQGKFVIYPTGEELASLVGNITKC